MTKTDIFPMFVVCQGAE